MIESYAFFSDIDILINNAGIIDRNSLLNLSQENIKKVFEVNAIAPFYLLQQFAKRMILKQGEISKKQDELKDYCIINITSISRKLPTGLSSYEVSKAALNQLTKSAAFELAQYNIRVNDIAPGLVSTNLNKYIWDKAPTLWNQRISGIPLNRGGTSEEVAQAVESVIDNKWMTGTTITIDGGRSVNWLGQDIPKAEDNYGTKAKL